MKRIRLLTVILTTLLIVGLLLSSCAEPSPSTTPASSSKPTTTMISPSTATTTPVGKTYTIKFATQMPVGNLSTKAGDKLATRVKELSSGRITVTHYPAGTLFVDTEIPKGLASGGVELAFINPSLLTQYDASLDIYTVYFVFGSSSQQEKAQPEILNHGNEKTVPVGIRLLGYSYNTAGDYAIANKVRMLVHPADLNGLRIRFGGKLIGDQINKGTGGVGVFMSSGEAYDAISKGTIDGAHSGIETVISRKWYEVGPYVNTIVAGCTPLGWPWFVGVNEKFWQSIDTTDKNIIQQAANEASSWVIGELQGSLQTHRKTIYEKVGDKSVWIEQNTPAWTEWYNALAPYWREPYIAAAGDRGKTILAIIDKYK